MFTNTYKLAAIILTASIALAACNDKSVIEKRIEVTEKQNKEISDKQEEKVEETPPQDIKISDGQEDALKEMENKDSAEEALSKNELDKRIEMDKDIPTDKEKYTDLNEFGQYISYWFYQYHSKKIDGKTFYEKVSPHFSENFNGLLPSTPEEKIQTFEILQDLFSKQIKAPLNDYAITDVELRIRVNEAGMYRKYILTNQETIYYYSVFVKEGDRWLLFDDGPSPPYVIDPTIESKFKEAEGE